MSAKTLSTTPVRHGEEQSVRAVSHEGPVFTPRVDIHEGDQGLTLEADLPGVLPENLEIEIDDNVLRIVGRVVDHSPPGSRPVYEEYTTGTFARSFILSDEIDRDHVSAALSEGVLRLELPKAKRARPHRIQVQKD
jgi:HSP20 family molecular chaperone IbpA